MAGTTFQDIARKYSLALELDETASPELWAARLKDTLDAKQRKLQETKPPQLRNFLGKECLELEDALEVANQEARRIGQDQLLEEIRLAIEDDNKELFDFLVTGKTRPLLPTMEEDKYKNWLGIKNRAAKKWSVSMPPPPPSPPPLAETRPKASPVKAVNEVAAPPEANSAPTSVTPQVAKADVPPPPPPGRYRWTNSLGQIFVSVPDTWVLFCIWPTRAQDFQWFVDETGYDATVGMYSLRRDGWKQWGDSWRRPGFAQGPSHPVCGVGWDDAQTFCRWLTAKERKAGTLAARQSYRLPTDAEWSLAVGTQAYPWGDQWPPPAGAGNYAGSEAADEDWPGSFNTMEGYRDGFPRTSPVGSFAPNACGLFDMGGNVWQWCEDWYRKEMNSEETRRKIPVLDNDGGGNEFRVLRGASWYDDDPAYLASACRGGYAPADRNGLNGFRCVLASGGASG